MKMLKHALPFIFILLFEITVGIMLLVNPEGFTNMIIVFFGIVLLLIGIVNLIKFIIEKKNKKTGILSITSAITSLILGAVCAFASQFVMGLFAVIAIIYGVILLISGIFKAQNYFQARKDENSLSFVTIISSILSVILGIIIAVNPFETTVVMWQFTGIVLLVEAIIDCAAVILSIKTNPSVIEVKFENKDKEDEDED